MIGKYKDKIKFIYKPAYKGNVKDFVAFASASQCWWYLQDTNRYGLEREYTPNKRQLKTDGWTVEKYQLVKVEQTKSKQRS